MAKRIVVTKMVTQEDERIPRVALYTVSFPAWDNEVADPA